MSWRRLFTFVSIVPLLLGSDSRAEPGITELNNDGGWCWFQDERAIVCGDALIVGTVAAGAHDPARKGNVEITIYNFSTGGLQRSVLHRGFPCDDHNAPALLVLGDGRILAMYSRHGSENRIYYRISRDPGEATTWQDERVFVPSESSRVTYSNLHRLSEENDGRGRVYNFFRGHDASFKPSWMTSDDDGRTWTARGLWIDYPAARKHRPYVKFASDDRDEIHFAFTEGHPRDVDNSIFHAYYRDGALHRSDGSRIKAVADGPITPSEATRVFAGDANNVAWISDLHLDEAGRPVLVYSVQKDSAGLDSSHPRAGQDHRYRYARWDGRRWHDHEIAHAGTRLYPGEDDYTGNICLVPQDARVVYLSSDVNIRTGEANAGGRYEIHRGVTEDFGASWEWQPLTENSEADNLRPLVPPGKAAENIVLWLRGQYRTYTDYDLDVVGSIGR